MQGDVVVVTDEMRRRARSGEPDRYLAALLAPRAVRNDLVALATFVAELRRIPELVDDPNLAEIRLTWWRDAVLDDAVGMSGNPAADAMRQLRTKYNLEREAITAWFDALAHGLHAAVPEDEAHLDLELGLAEGTPFALAAAICLNEKPSPLVEAACHAGGIAYGMARLGLNFPRALARGRMPLPNLVPTDAAASPEAPRCVDGEKAQAALAALASPRVDACKASFSALARAAQTALLPLALVEPYLRASCAQGHDLTRQLADVAPLTRVWRIWRAHVTSRL